ncbi:MAG: gamma-glutamyltransferase [Candidatus Zhuqueibacterota bacterium]
MMKKNLSVLIAILFLALLSHGELFCSDTSGTSGMVVTAHPLASELGLEVLKSGGNAVDAAVASALVIGAVEPHASGLGGGGAMLVYLSEQDTLTYINYYACAPEKVADGFDARHESSSARSVLVPGTVAGLHYALSKYGAIPWNELVLLVIEKIRDGIVVDGAFHQIILDSYDKLLLDPRTRTTYLVNDFPPEPGHRLRNAPLVATLQKLASEGPDVFYRGEIADSIEAVMIRTGGGLRAADLENYQVREVPPLHGTYRGYDIFSSPPPHSGITVLETLNILEFTDLRQSGDFVTSPASFHVMAEAMKLASVDRLHYLGDPKFDPSYDDILISKSFARARFETIDMAKAHPVHPESMPAGDISRFLKTSAPAPYDKEGSTTHISIVDARGNAVSLTQTLNHFWGSGISVCGFLLNNGMTTFFEGDSLNRAQPGKQPRTTIAPSILFRDDKLAIVLGTPGAGRILSTLVEVICNLIDFDKDPHLANAAPRFYCQKSGTAIAVESRFDEALLQHLKAMGHSIEQYGEMDLFFGGVQLIMIDSNTGTFTGSSDPRRPGVALGY